MGGSLALLLLRGDDHTWIRRLALVVSLAEFVLSLWLIRAFDSSEPSYQLEEARRWISSPPINYHVGIDGISLFLIILTTLLTPIAILASWNSIHERVKGFYISLLVLEAGVIGVFVSLDLFLFFPLLGSNAHSDVLPDRHSGATSAESTRRSNLFYTQCSAQS